MEGAAPKLLQAQQARELYILLENVFAEMELDWTAVREDEDSQIVQLTENSICCLNMSDWDSNQTRLPEIQALKDLIVTLPGFEVSKEVEAGDSDEGLAVNATGEDSEGEGQEDDEEAGFAAAARARQGYGYQGVLPFYEIECKGVCPGYDNGCKEGAVIPPGIAQQLEALDPEEAASLLEAQQNMKAEIRNENKRKAAAKCGVPRCEAKIAKAKAKAKAKDSAKKRKGEETKPMAADPATKPKPSKDHTIQDMLEMLEPAFAIGLPQPTEQSKQKKCYTVPAPGLGCASISVMAGSTKNFFVNRGASGGLPKFLREILGLKMDTNFNTGISIRRFGAAFAYEVALVIACHRTLEPPALCAEDVRRRFKELFSHSPQDLLIMTG
ncbi:unnamed protein product [Symbiodinium microadriaticum]|nr:unnamed protein product [Symbiodinium microadriaticum]